MNHTTFPGGATIVNLLPLANITASGNGAGADLQPYRGVALALLDAAAPSAGTNPTLAIKLQGSPEASKITSVTPTGGNGNCMVEAGVDPVAETITVAFSSASAFTVSGSVTGAMAAGTVGTPYTSAQVNFLISAGSTPWANGNTVAIVTTARTWTDLTGGAFTGQTSALLREKKAINLDQAPRYLRAVKTLGGTVSPAYLASLNLLVTSD